MPGIVRRWHSLLAWLGVFAILMAFIGPLISQSERLLGMPVVHAMTLHGQADGLGHGGAVTDNTRPAQHTDLAACGYCTLFLHMPGVAPPPVVAMFEPAARGAIVITRRASSPLTVCYPRYIGRGPPRSEYRSLLLSSPRRLG